MASVQVVVRLRPMNSKETKEGTLPVITASTSNKSVTVIKGVGAKQARSQFTFDNVFTSFSTQQDVFSVTLRPVIVDVLKGFETCVFAYGQTGTGKTHTMEGDLDNPDQFGVIPRAAQSIFECLQQSTYLDAKVSCSYLEIYNEELSDLLVTDHTAKLDIVQGSKGVQCRGLSQHQVQSARDVLKLMQEAVQTRRVGETSMNKHSSRSHCIFTICVDTKQKLPDGSIMEAQGKLHMVDLAGSESAKTAILEQSSQREQAAREQERRNINKSLLTLGRVISILKEQSENKNKTAMIPYRDSKLTRILQEALGGRCKTVIIATISPSIINLQESLQTLHYAQTANGIKNKPISNSYMSMAMSSTVSLLPSDGTVPMAAERWQEMEIRMEHMQQEVEEARHALARNYMQQQEMKERAEKAELELQESEYKLGVATNRISTLVNELNQEHQAKEAVQAELQDSKVTLRKTIAILKATQQTEQALTSEALLLIQALKDSVADGNKLHNLLQGNHNDEVMRRSATREFYQSVSTVLKGAIATLDEIASIDKENQGRSEKALALENQKRLQAIDETVVVVSSIAALMEDVSTHINQSISTQMIPQMSLLSGEMRSKITKTREQINLGDENLKSSCGEAIRHLEESSTKLRTMITTHKEQTEHSLMNVRIAIDASKAKAETMVKDAEEAIKQAQLHSKATRTTLNNVLLDWKSAGVEVTNRIIEVSSAQHLVLGNTYDFLNNEMSCHQTVNKELEAQVEYLRTLEEAQIETLEKQSMQLDMQQRQLDEAKVRQASLCKTVMSTVINGVRDLVTEQLQLVMADQAKRTEELISNSCMVKDLNDVLCGASVELFEELKSTNSKLRAEAKSLQDADASVLTVLDAGKSAISCVLQLAEEHQSALDNCATGAQRQIEDLECNDKKISKARDSLRHDRELLTKFMNESSNTATDSIALIAEKGSKLASFSSDVIIHEATKSFSQITEPSEKVRLQLFQELQSMEDTIVDGVNEISNLATGHSESIDDASMRMRRSVDEFKSTTCDQHRFQSKEMRNNLTNMIKSHGEATMVSVGICRDHIANATEKTQNFGHSVIKMDEDAGFAPSRTMIDFNSDLTATPDEEFILKGIDLEVLETSPILNTSTTTTEECKSMENKSTRESVLRESSLGNQNTNDDEISPGKRRLLDSGRLPRRTKRKE